MKLSDTICILRIVNKLHTKSDINTRETLFWSTSDNPNNSKQLLVFKNVKSFTLLVNVNLLDEALYIMLNVSLPINVIIWSLSEFTL